MDEREEVADGRGCLRLVLLRGQRGIQRAPQIEVRREVIAGCVTPRPAVDKRVGRRQQLEGVGAEVDEVLMIAQAPKVSEVTAASPFLDQGLHVSERPDTDVVLVQDRKSVV